MAVSEFAKVQAVDVLTRPGLSIAEYFGAASTGEARLSACLASVAGPCVQAYQTPEFDQYIMVVSGRLHVACGGSTVALAQGEGISLPAGQRVLWKWPEPCQYVIICLPDQPSRLHSGDKAGLSPPPAHPEKPAAMSRPFAQPKRRPSPFSSPALQHSLGAAPPGRTLASLECSAWHPGTQSMAPTEDPNLASEAATETEGTSNTPMVFRSSPDCPPGFLETARMSAFEQAPDVDGLLVEERPARYGARHLSTPVVIVASELHPWSKTGGLAMVTSAYAFEFAVRGHRTLVVSPRYGEFGQCQYVGCANVWLDGQQHEVRYFHQRQEFGAGKGCDYIFVDHHSFRRAGVYGDPVRGGEYEDNLFRFALLSVAAAEAPLVLELGGSAYGQEVCFVANDWQAGLLPVYLFYKYKRNRTYRKARCIVVLHNLGYQGRFRKSAYPVDRFLGLPLEAENELQCDDAHLGRDCINLIAAGIQLADRVLTVSPSYAKEIQTPEGGFGLDAILREKAISLRLAGILNGISDEWCPLRDPHIARRYGPSDFVEGKSRCKAALQQELGLTRDPNAALVGFCGRLCSQKGVQLVTSIVHWLMHDEGSGVSGRAQVVLMGRGDPGYERQLRGAEAAHPGRVCGYVGFDPAIEHRMMAGCDLLLMPSQYEPCGLPQMYAQQYGTIPVAHQTGGIQDSVRDLADEVRDRHAATGFLFAGLDAGRFRERLSAALDTFFNKKALFQQMQANAMQCSFYWPRAIDEYERHIDFTMEDSPCRN
mmetsp:Transcript_104555/g.312262  ORF Transcript_104555/g.312262 Transcript_104555/m.312262 type:complete len:765 (-) Transcript_104555:50-2344(-)